MFTPLRFGSVSVVSSVTLFCFRKSIASRIVASRNSSFGMMICSSLRWRRWVRPPSVRALLSIAMGPVANLRTGRSHVFSSCHDMYERVWLYPATAYSVALLVDLLLHFRAAMLYGSMLRICSQRLKARSKRPVS